MATNKWIIYIRSAIVVDSYQGHRDPSARGEEFDLWRLQLENPRWNSTPDWSCSWSSESQPVWPRPSGSRTDRTCPCPRPRCLSSSAFRPGRDWRAKFRRNPDIWVACSSRFPPKKVWICLEEPIRKNKTKIIFLTVCPCYWLPFYHFYLTLRIGLLNAPLYPKQMYAEGVTILSK